MHLCPRLVFPSIKHLFRELLLGLLEKKLKNCMFLSMLTKCHSTTTSFDLWMSKDGHNIFALVIKFLRAI